MSATDLLHVLAGTPDLHGAACVTHHEIFDACLGIMLATALGVFAVEFQFQITSGMGGKK